VLVRTRAGKTLSSNHVQAIVNLVSSSVQGLTPETVTVADTAGNVLSAPGQNAVGGLGTVGSTRIEQTKTFESALATQIESMLASVVGTGKAVVTVNADLDFDKSTATSETFSSPSADGQPLPKAESNRSEQYEGAVPGDSGVLGPTTAIEGGSGDTSYTLEESEADNAVNRVVETTERAPGAIDRLSVAVLVDEGFIDSGRITEIEDLVAAAAGVKPARGDQLVVSTLPFDTSEAEANESELAALEAQQKREERMRLYTTIGAVVVVLAVLGLAYRAFTKSRRRDDGPIDLREDEGLLSAEAATVFEDDGLLDGEQLIEETLPELPAAPQPTEEDLLVARIGAHVNNLVEQQPDEVALLLRTWLGDRRTVKR
jgi:flagellar M-ring protein FliF